MYCLFISCYSLLGCFYKVHSVLLATKPLPYVLICCPEVGVEVVAKSNVSVVGKLYTCNSRVCHVTKCEFLINGTVNSFSSIQYVKG